MAAGGSTLVSDIVAGIFLARDGDFNVGDEIKAGEEPAIQGIVERLDARRVRIRDTGGILHVLPNSVVERKAWTVIRRRAQVLADARAKAAKLAARDAKAVASKS
jgi:small-conductance mechanosensitive channel